MDGVPEAESYAISKRTVRRALLLVAAAVALVILLVLVVAVVRSHSGSADSLASAIDSGEYQAVFLTTGQEYFGKLSAPGGDFYYLGNV